jgi:hypothetical protein
MAIAKILDVSETDARPEFSDAPGDKIGVFIESGSCGQCLNLCAPAESS